MQPRSGRQAEQVHAASRDVLAHLAFGYVEAHFSQLVVEFGVYEMHLPQVRLVRVLRNSRAVLNRLAQNARRPRRPGPPSSRILSSYL